MTTPTLRPRCYEFKILEQMLKDQNKVNKTTYNRTAEHKDISLIGM